MKSSKRTLIIVIVMILILAAGTAAGIVIFNSGKSPTTADNNAPGLELSGTQDEQGSESLTFADPFSDEEALSALRDEIAREAQQTDGKIELTFWCSGDDLSFEKQQLNAFKEAIADSRYEITVKTKVKGEDEAPGAMLENTEKGADVFTFTDDCLARLSDSDVLYKVNDRFKGYISGSDLSFLNEAASINGELYAFPRSWDHGYVLFYDKRVLSEDDVGDIETIITKSAESGKSLCFPLTNSYYATGIYLAAGCDISCKDGVQTADLDSDEGMAAIDGLCRLAKYEEGFVDVFPEYLSSDSMVKPVYDKFKDGTLSAVITGTYHLNDIKKAIGAENVGAAKLPALTMNGVKRPLMTFTKNSMLGVKGSTKYPVTAQALACYLTREDAQRMRYESRGIVPANKRIIAGDSFTPDSLQAAFEAQKPYSAAYSSTVSASYWGSGIWNIWDEVKKSGGELTDEKKHEILAAVEDTVNNLSKH